MMRWMEPNADVYHRTLAFIAWEAACERLREALHPPPGYPEAHDEEIEAAFANAAARFAVLRAEHPPGPLPSEH